MFERWLPRSRYIRVNIGLDEMVDELSILDLCQQYRLEYPGGAVNVASIWDESEQHLADGGPMFADLARLGWVCFDGGRWLMESTPAGTFSDIIYPSPSTKAFLTGLGKPRLVAKTNAPHPEALALSALISENWLDRHIPAKNRSWLAGRLWERLCPKPQSRPGDSSGSAMRAPAPEVDEASGPSKMLEAEPADLELIAVLAKSEMGLRGEAMAILDAAISEFGTDDRLSAAKNDLQVGDATGSFLAMPLISVSASLMRWIGVSDFQPKALRRNRGENCHLYAIAIVRNLPSKLFC
jgi:hypothetical protein